MEGTGDIFLPSVSPTTSSTFCLKPNPQFVDNLHFLLSLIFLCFQKSTVVTMRETWKCTYSTGYNSFTIFSQCLISQKSSFQRRIKNNITIIILPFLHVALLFDWLETTARIIKTTCKPCICKGYMCLQITVSPRFLPSRRKERGLYLQAKATCFYDDCFFTWPYLLWFVSHS